MKERDYVMWNQPLCHERLRLFSCSDLRETNQRTQMYSLCTRHENSLNLTYFNGTDVVIAAFSIGS